MPKIDILFVVALALYSIAIWSANQTRIGLSPLKVIVFGLALVADYTGTVVVCMTAKNWSWNAHAILGFTALGIMVVHFLIAFWAVLGNEDAKWKFEKYSIPAWFLWLITFLSGIFVQR